MIAFEFRFTRQKEHFMKRSARFLFALATLVAVLPVAAYAHFHLMEPASAIVENERGDPQKAAPCGGSNVEKGTPTNAVTKVIGGSMLHVKVQEAVFHPGHYRVSLANSPDSLAADPEVQTKDSERGAWSVSATIQSPVKMPILADGLWPHTARPTGPYEADIPLPNVNCAKCTLQVVQFMAEHAYNNPGGYSYHHCANLVITADPKKPIDKAWTTMLSATVSAAR